MDTLEERFLIYAALLMLCCAAAAFVGPAGALWSFVQIVAVTELVFLLGAPLKGPGIRNP